jgi:hypothetical protein
VALFHQGTTLAKRAAMLRRSLAAASIAAAIASTGTRAEAAGAWASSAATTPLEQRVAMAVGPQRVTLWTSLRFESPGGPLVIIVPAPPGASLDIASDAWFEALEVATAPRIFPPASGSPFCPGKSGSPNVFQLDGDVSHTASLAPQEIVVFDDPQKIVTWASQSGVSIPAAVQAALAKLTSVSFLGVSFDVPAGEGLTPTLRVAMSSVPPSLPFTLTRAASEDLRVTTWTIGPGRGDLIGNVEVSVAPSSLAWNANDVESDYASHRTDALASDPTRFLVEASNHDRFGKTATIAGGTATIDSVVSTFFERAAAYGDGNFDAAACIATAEPTFSAAAPVAEACPAAALGVVPPATTCIESPGTGKTNPSLLRCGPGADDLAIALSGIAPKNAFLSRHAMVIPAGGAGVDTVVGFPSTATTSPVITAATIDYADCDKPDGGSSSSSSSSSGQISSGGPIIHDYGNDPGAGVYVDIDLDDFVDPVYDEGCSCDNSYSSYSSDDPGLDDCSSDTSSTADSCSSDTADDSSCSGDGTDASGCDSGGDGYDSCDGGGDSFDSCDSGGGGDACSSGGGADCGGGLDFGDCSTSRGRRLRAPKFSILLVTSLFLLVPLRRRGTLRRRKKRAVC